MANKLFYVGYSYMGTNFSYDSPCWQLFAFWSEKDREEYLQKHEYKQDTGNLVAEKVTRKQAEQIIGHSLDNERVRREQIDEKMIEISYI